MKAYNATVGGGNRAHAVILDKVLPYNQRRDRMYQTVCRQMVRGSSVYLQPFGQGAVRSCDNCSKRLAQRMQMAEEAPKLPEAGPHTTAQTELNRKTMSLGGRLEQLLTLLDGRMNEAISAQESVQMYHRGTTAESVVTIHGKRYFIRLEEVD